jgi:hypothetical protein
MGSWTRPPVSRSAGRRGQALLNDTGAREPEHTFRWPVPITARIVWEHDGEEHIETEALGWTGRDVYVADAPTCGTASRPCG